MTAHNSYGVHRNRLSAAVTGVLLLSAGSAALAQESADTSKAAATTLDTITVTGSRIKRSEIEGPAPVTVITATQIEKEGFSTVFEALRTLSQAGGEAVNDLTGINSFAPLAAPINLRGLGPGRTLMLINGRRVADYPWANGNSGNFPSFDSIPTGAIERVEILSAGASAIYGSDAVAGVVNIILKQDYDGDTLKLRGSTTTTGGGDAYSAQWAGGRTGDNWGLTYAFEARGNELMYVRQREFMDSFRDSPVAIDPLLGFIPPITLRVTYSGGTRSGTHVPTPAGTCDKFGFETVDARELSGTAPNQTVRELGQVCGNDAFPARTFLTGRDVLGGYLYGTWNFSDNLEGWGSLMFNTMDAELGAGMLSISGPQRYGGLVTPDGQTLTRGESITTRWYDAGLGSEITASRRLTAAEHGGEANALQFFSEKAFDVAFGLRGSIADRWDWDFTVSRAEFTSDMQRTLLNTARVTDYFFGPQLSSSDPACAEAGSSLCYRIDLDRWFTPLTPEQYSELSDQVTYQNESWVSTASLVFSGDLFELPAGPVGFAAVLDAASQGYDTNPPVGLLAENRTNYQLTTTAGGGERDRYAAGVEFRVPILDSLKASLAARYDKYDDITEVDDAKTWGLGLEWRPFDSLLVRGNYSTSFKAPDMHFVFNEGTTTQPVVNDDFRCVSSGGTFGSSTTPSTCTTPDVYRYPIDGTTTGDPTLEEEEGESWGVGLVWDITDNMSATVDYWDITLRGEVKTVSVFEALQFESACLTGLNDDRTPFTDFALDSAFCQNMIARVTREAVSDDPNLAPRIEHVLGGYINQALRHLNGIDASFNYRLATERWGDFNWTLGWSHTLTFEGRVFDSDPIEDTRDVRSNNTLRSRTRGSMGWSRNGWSSNVFFTRLGSLPSGDRTYRLAPHITWNWNISRNITDNARISLFVNNVFNRYYTDDPTELTYPFFNHWYGTTALGREIAAQFELKF